MLSKEQRNDIEGCSQGLKSSSSSSVIRHSKTIIMAEKYTLNLAALCIDSGWMYGLRTWSDVSGKNLSNEIESNPDNQLRDTC